MTDTIDRLPTTTTEQRAHYNRAVMRAGAVLKQGDRVRMHAHGSDRPVTYTFDHWDKVHPGFFVSISGVEELHPYNIISVNGEPTCFRDETGAAWVLSRANDDGIVRYMALKTGIAEHTYWTTDKSKAMRFLSKAAADTYAEQFYRVPLTAERVPTYH